MRWNFLYVNLIYLIVSYLDEDIVDDLLNQWSKENASEDECNINFCFCFRNIS